jgi:hypothetical protein
MQPEERVKAFIADYHRSHTELKQHPDDHDQFDRWEALVETLDQSHFFDQGGLELARSIEGTSPHTLADEPIVSLKRAGDRVFVETRTDVSIETFYEYELREVQAGDWRIVRLREFLDPADASFVDEDERERFENPTLHPLQKLSKKESQFDGDTLFEAGRSIELDDVDSIEVRAVGLLNVTTGILAVGDLAYDPSTLAPVGQRVSPGNYPVEVAVAVAFRRNLAVRVRLSDQKVVKWHPANMGENGGHVIGVDAGNAAIMDVAAIMTLNARDKERALELYTYATERPRALMLSLISPNDTAVVDSGWGDGGYPVYWGVDTSGIPAVLIVDFMLLDDA